MLEELDRSLEALEEATTKILNDLLKSIPESADQIYDEVYDFASQLKRNPNGTYAQSAENLKTINSFRPKLDSIIENTGYNDAVYKFTGEFKDLRSLMGDVFSTMAVTVPQDVLFDQITNISIQNSIDGLLGDGLNANFNEGIFTILKEGVTGGADKNAVKDQLLQYIKGSTESPGKFIRYADQISGDLVHQYQSNYFSVISQDLDMKYYLYKGTKIRDSRQFCKNAAGKVYTEAALKAYINQQSNLNGGKGWDGMIPGTNWSNFAQNRGGYRCRHTLVPITKAVYDMLKPLA